MKNVLSKSLLCGVLATSFLIINCQKAPSRPIKSGGGDGSGKITALKIGDCTPAAVTALTARDAALKTLKAEADKKPTDVDGKKKLDDLAKDLEAKTKAVSDEITKIKVGNDKADGCKVTDADKKVTTYELPALNAETLKMSKIVQGITGSSTPGVVADDAILRSGDQITIAADLAKALSDAAKSCVSDGKALSGADCDTAVANKAITSCVLTNTDGKAVDANAKAGAVVSDAKMDATSKRNVVAIVLTIKAEGGDRAAGINCSIAEAAKDAKASTDEVTKALGKLIAKVPKAPVVADPKVTPAAPSEQMGPPAPPAAPPAADPAVDAPAAAALKVRASEALSDLNAKLGN